MVKVVKESQTMSLVISNGKCQYKPYIEIGHVQFHTLPNSSFNITLPFNIM